MSVAEVIPLGFEGREAGLGGNGVRTRSHHRHTPGRNLGRGVAKFRLPAVRSIP